jgi:hypothetical protein
MIMMENEARGLSPLGSVVSEEGLATRQIHISFYLAAQLWQ